MAGWQPGVGRRQFVSFHHAEVLARPGQPGPGMAVRSVSAEPALADLAGIAPRGDGLLATA
jgi:hypothetical protein